MSGGACPECERGLHPGGRHWGCDELPDNDDWPPDDDWPEEETEEEEEEDDDDD